MKPTRFAPLKLWVHPVPGAPAETSATAARAPGARAAGARLRAVTCLLTLSGALLVQSAEAASRRAKKVGDATPVPASAGAAAAAALPPFAPLPADHPLAGLWNDPEMARRLWGSFGFLSEREPRLSPEEQALYRDTLLPLLREDSEKAIPALEAAVKPEASALFDYTLGTVYFQRGDFARAIGHFETALAKLPDFLRAQRNLALALVREGRYAEAVPALSRALALGGADGRLYGLLAFAQVQLGRYLPATAAYQQALLFEPDHWDYLLGLIKCYVATANYSAALALLEDLLARHPDREVLWTLQANVFIQQNQLARAVVNFEVLRRLGQANPAQLSLLGDLHLAEGAPDLALSAYLEAARLDGGTNLARSLRAVELLAARGSWTEARQLLERSRELASAANQVGEDEAKLLRLEARVALGSGEGERALQTLERLLALHPLDGEALLLAGDGYKQAGDLERAAFRYDAAAKVEGFEADALVKHAQLLVEQRRYPQAVELLRRAQRFRPRDHIQRYLEKVEQVAARSRS